MNNIVNQIPCEEKLQTLMDKQCTPLLDFEDQLDEKYEYRTNKLENDGFRAGCYLGLDDLYGIVNDATSCKAETLNHLNVQFDKAINRFKIYRGKKWENYLEDAGAREVVSLLRSYYLGTYEIYLIRNLHSDNRNHQLNRFKLLEHLEIYYRFIGSFDILPQVADLSDEDILKHRLLDNNDRYLSEKYCEFYFKLSRELKISERNRIKRKVINIVRDNTAQNLQELNKAIMELLKLDEGFKQEIIKSRQLMIQEPDDDF